MAELERPILGSDITGSSIGGYMIITLRNNLTDKKQSFAATLSIAASRRARGLLELLCNSPCWKP